MALMQSKRAEEDEPVDSNSLVDLEILREKNFEDCAVLTADDSETTTNTAETLDHSQASAMVVQDWLEGAQQQPSNRIDHRMAPIVVDVEDCL